MVMALYSQKCSIALFYFVPTVLRVLRVATLNTEHRKRVGFRVTRQHASFWFCCARDRGANETQARKRIQVLVSFLSNAIFLDGNCFHSLQLCVLGGLKAVDELLQENGRKGRYYSALAILAHCVRDSTKDVFSSWSKNSSLAVFRLGGVRSTMLKNVCCHLELGSTTSGQLV